MKANIFGLGCSHIPLAALLFTMFVPAGRAQNLTMIYPSQARRVVVPFYADDSHGGSYQPSFFTFTNVGGLFNVSDTESSPGSFDHVSATCTASHDSIITATSTSLSITGKLEISSSGSAVSSETGSGSASWSDLSEIFIGFTIDQSFAYSLQASTVMNTNSTETSPIAFVGLDHHGDSPGSLPDIVAYGSEAYPGGFTTAPSAAGTSTGVFTAGTYYFIARVHSMTSVDPDHTPMSEHFLVTFNLSVTYLPPQPPLITAFTPGGANQFNLVWNAPQAGNYRVLSSTNLAAWSELIPSAAAPSGLNTNVVNGIPGSGAGFFRIQYLP